MSAQPQTTIYDELLRCREWIEAALEYSGGTHDFVHVCEGIISGHMQLWPNENGCAVTEIIVYPKKKVLHVFLAGGKMSDILDMLPSAREFARREGCSGMSIAGRRGWERVLKKHGFDFMHKTLGAEI